MNQDKSSDAMDESPDTRMNDPRVRGWEFAAIRERAGLTQHNVSVLLRATGARDASENICAFLESITVVPAQFVAPLRVYLGEEEFDRCLRDVRRTSNQPDTNAPAGTDTTNTFGSQFGELLKRVREEHG